MDTVGSNVEDRCKSKKKIDSLLSLIYATAEQSAQNGCTTHKAGVFISGSNGL